MQVPELNDPDVAGAAVNVTVPVGVELPLPPVSVTVTVQVEAWFTTTLAGAQTTTVLVVLLSTVSENELLLARWSPSPPYEPVMLTEPTPELFGVKVTEHAPPERVHVAEEKDPALAGAAVNVIVPVGVALAPPVSETVAVQVVPWLTPSGFGAQTTAVEVVILVAVIVEPADGPLPEWSVSPA